MAKRKSNEGGHTRSSAEERREEILAASIEEFARHGLHGTSVYAIAERLDISQPYIFRLFGTKNELFVAATRRVCERIQQAFGEAAQSNPQFPLKAMAKAYEPLLARRSELLVLLQAFAASGDEEIRGPVAKRYTELWEFVAEKSDASIGQVRDFFAAGMGMTVAAALGLESLYADSKSAAECD